MYIYHCKERKNNKFKLLSFEKQIIDLADCDLFIHYSTSKILKYYCIIVLFRIFLFLLFLLFLNKKSNGLLLSRVNSSVTTIFILRMSTCVHCKISKMCLGIFKEYIKWFLDGSPIINWISGLRLDVYDC